MRAKENIQVRIDKIVLTIDPTGRLKPHTEELLRNKLKSEGYDMLEIEQAIRHYR